jgi:hypothetical protein
MLGQVEETVVLGKRLEDQRSRSADDPRQACRHRRPLVARDLAGVGVHCDPLDAAREQPAVTTEDRPPRLLDLMRPLALAGGFGLPRAMLDELHLHEADRRSRGP